MRFLTDAESAEWCSRRGYPTRQREGYIVGQSRTYRLSNSSVSSLPCRQTLGERSGWRDFFMGLSTRRPELLIWIGDWAVWPSGQHMPLFARRPVILSRLMKLKTASRF